MGITDINRLFPNSIDALRYFEHVRWGDTVKCAYCNSEKVSERQIDGRFHCSSCRRTFSVTTGTFLHSTKIPLKYWLYAFYAMEGIEHKYSAKRLQREINVTYSTAWFMCRNIKDLVEQKKEEEYTGNLFDQLCKKAVTLPLVQRL